VKYSFDSYSKEIKRIKGLSGVIFQNCACSLRSEFLIPPVEAATFVHLAAQPAEELDPPMARLEKDAVFVMVRLPEAWEIAPPPAAPPLATPTALPPVALIGFKGAVGDGQRALI